MHQRRYVEANAHRAVEYEVSVDRVRACRDPIEAQRVDGARERRTVAQRAIETTSDLCSETIESRPDRESCSVCDQALEWSLERGRGEGPARGWTRRR